MATLRERIAEAANGSGQRPVASGQKTAVSALRADLRNCAPCKARLLAEMKAAQLPIANRQLPIANERGRWPLAIGHSPLAISVVIASLNEQDNLVATVASVKHDCPEAEIVVVDDGSTQPEPISAIRNPRRIGGPRSRRLGALAATGDVVIFLDAHNALDWETAVWFSKRYPEVGPIRPEVRAALDMPNKIRTQASAALNCQLPIANSQSVLSR